MRTAFLLTVLMLGCVSPAVASPVPPPAPVVYGPPSPTFPPRVDRAFIQLRSEIIELRRIALELQANDGGTLTKGHRDFLQARIDAAYRRYYASR